MSSQKKTKKEVQPQKKQKVARAPEKAPEKGAEAAPGAAFEGGDLSAQSSQIQRLPSAYRQDVMRQIGQVQGNRHVQRIIEGQRQPADEEEQVARAPAEETKTFGNSDPRGQISTLHPDMQSKVRQLIENARAKGLDVWVFQGMRTIEEQNELYAKGRTKPGSIVTKVKGGGSYHNYGVAADIVFHGKAPWGEEHDWSALGQAGVDAGLEWGGNWKSFVDRPHFQMPELSMSQLKTWNAAGGMENVWKNIGNGGAKNDAEKQEDQNKPKVPAPAPATGESIGTAKVTASALNVRVGPGASHAALGQLKQGEEVSVLKREGSWLNVAYNGKSAYVHGDYATFTPVEEKEKEAEQTQEAQKPESKAPSIWDQVVSWWGNLWDKLAGGDQKAPVETPTKPSSTPPTPTVPTQTVETATVTASALNVRTGASGSATKLGLLRSGEKVDVLGREGDWLKINYQGKTGYIHGGYVKLSTESKPAPEPTEDKVPADKENPEAGLNAILMELETTGASDQTAKQDRLKGGVEASSKMAQTDLNRVKKYAEVFVKIASAKGLPPALLAAIASRESRGGNILDENGCGDHGNGFGIMQVDKRYHKTTGGPASEEHITQAAGILKDMLNTIKKKHPKWTAAQQLKGAVAAYNSGTGNVQTLERMDVGTTGNDYSADVWARARHYAQFPEFGSASEIEQAATTDMPGGTKQDAAIDKATVTASALNVRAAAGSSGAKVGLLKQGNTVDVLGREGQWLKIRHEGKAAYVHGDYVLLASAKDTGQQGAKGNGAEPTITYNNCSGGPATAHSEAVLKEILKTAGESSAVVTSTTRTPQKQAEVMYYNIVSQGVASQKALYGSYGDQIIDTYVKLTGEKKTAAQIIAGMKAKIDELGPNNVSKHCGDPNVLQAIDISPGSITNTTAFIKAVNDAIAAGKVRKYIKAGSPGEKAHHVEIHQ